MTIDFLIESVMNELSKHFGTIDGEIEKTSLPSCLCGVPPVSVVKLKSLEKKRFGVIMSSWLPFFNYGIRIR
jgi:hypothetical protein